MHEEILQQLKVLRDRLKAVEDENLSLKGEVAALKEENLLLKDEIAILKGQKPRPKIPPSILEGSQSKDKHKGSTTRGQHPRKNKTKLEIHIAQRIAPENVPQEAVFKGLLKFDVQDIRIESCNTRYLLERWQLPDGTYLTGKTPANIRGHYGPELVAYILNQYHSCRVTEPLLLNHLREMGVLISSGQLSQLLTEDQEAFHREKEELIPAGIKATGQVKTDDTGGRHRGTNEYTTVISNEFFASFSTTASKSRINFLSLLQGTTPTYLFNEDAVVYIERFKPESRLNSLLVPGLGRGAMREKDWDEFLLSMKVTSPGEKKLATEASLYANLIENGVPRDLGVHADDAGQFDVFVRSLCWIHEERHYRKLHIFNDETQQAIDKVRDGIWNLYKGLKAYKLSPSEAQSIILEKQFDDLFSQETSIVSLNERLKMTREKKEDLLRVLKRPDTPLHNNETETDARAAVIKRKISGGTRSCDGKRCRDTFLSLKQTCRKLGISFWKYLKDRVRGYNQIPRLAEIIAMRSSPHHETS